VELVEEVNNVDEGVVGKASSAVKHKPLGRISEDEGLVSDAGMTNVAPLTDIFATFIGRQSHQRRFNTRLQTIDQLCELGRPDAAYTYIPRLL
jgi:hypothetical protein